MFWSDGEKKSLFSFDSYWWIFPFVHISKKYFVFAFINVIFRSHILVCLCVWLFWFESNYLDMVVNKSNINQINWLIIFCYFVKLAVFFCWLKNPTVTDWDSTNTYTYTYKRTNMHTFHSLKYVYIERNSKSEGDMVSKSLSTTPVRNANLCRAILIASNVHSIYIDTIYVCLFVCMTVCADQWAREREREREKKPRKWRQNKMKSSIGLFFCCCCCWFW